MFNGFVLPVQGAARLEFADGREASLVPGDGLDIRAHQQHRAAWTDPQQDTVWLAVHYLLERLQPRFVLSSRA